MRGNVKLLDCTLRDGGYVNNWAFGNLTIRSVVSRLDNAGIDIIECGFLDSRVNYDKNRSIFPDISSITNTLAGSLPKRAMLVAMIDFGTFRPELLVPKKDSVLDGIRVIFKKENFNEALKYAKNIKLLGYELFLNPVALTSYHDIEILYLLKKINEIQPYGMSIVDTYGLMFNNDMEKYIYLIDSNLHPSIALGYHSHNNLQMGNAHCISYVNKNLCREIIIDSSILGMGKNAGNACTELLCSYFDKSGLKNIELDQIFECAYTDIAKFGSLQKWGYGLDTLLSAICDCSPNWIKFLTNKNTLSIKDIRTILNSLPFEKREVSYFKKELAEQIYVDYMSNHIDDMQAKSMLTHLLNKRPILILCPGMTLKTYYHVINTYIQENAPFVITVNFVTNMFNSNYVFISNAKRYSQMLGIYPSLDEKPSVFVTSNIVISDYLIPDLIFDYKTLYEQSNGDNSAVLLIALLKNIGVSHLAIAGMDGFNEVNFENNFFDSNIQLGIATNLNDTISTQLRKIVAGSHDLLEWLTPTIYK